MYSFAAFCLVLALTLPSLGLPAFALGVGVSVGMLGVTRRLLAKPAVTTRSRVANE
jgi:hypothetical protein